MMPPTEVPEAAFSLDTNNREAWARLDALEGMFPSEGVKLKGVSKGMHVRDGKTCCWVYTNIRDNLELLARVEHWIVTGKLN